MIHIQHLTKSYQTPKGRHYVYKDMDVVLPGGRSIAILGKNGAGKSTLLRIIGGVDFPDRGRIVSDHTISWPMNMSGGFQTSLTARQNVRFVARLYAPESEVDAKVAFVEEFADIGKYFDMPIKSYSSGMRSRVTFGLNVAFDFDYYLMDEVAGVGDAIFRKKCEEHLERLRATSHTLMVSHNLDTLQKHCQSALLLMDSNGVFYDDVNEAIEVYKQHVVARKRQV